MPQELKHGSSKPVGIRPQVTMLSVLRHLNYKPWFALAEFIDNSLQSYLANREELHAVNGSNYKFRVTVKIETNPPGRIVISDNAAGISLEDFPRAFRAAQVPTDRAGLSEFGMGMKSAACWFSENWSVRTKAINSSVERKIEFDIKNIVENNVEALDVSERDSGSIKGSYTVVVLNGLHHVPQGRTIGKIKEHLASIYRVFMRDGQMQLFFGDELLKYSEVPVLRSVEYKAPGVPVEGGQLIIWKKSIDFDFGQGQRITGFAALREVGSTNLAGFSIFRRNRLIEGSYDETYRPDFIFKQTNSYRYQRLFGELHAEGFEVSHTKNGFRWEEFEEEFLDCLKQELESGDLNILAQADNYRALPSKKSILAKAEYATNLVGAYVESNLAPILKEVSSDPASHFGDTIPDHLEVSKLQSSEKVVLIDDGIWQWSINLRTSVDYSREDWVSVAKSQDLRASGDTCRKLTVELSLVHPFSSEFLGVNNENIELLLRFAVVVGIALILAEDVTGNAPETTLYHINKLLRGVLSKGELAIEQ